MANPTKADRLVRRPKHTAYRPKLLDLLADKKLATRLEKLEKSIRLSSSDPDAVRQQMEQIMTNHLPRLSRKAFQDLTDSIAYLEERQT